MTTKRKKTTIEELPEWEDEKPREEQIDSEDQEMESIRNSLPGGVRCISVYRMHKAGLGGRPKFIAEIPPEQFRESFIQEMYGGGNYFGRWTKKDGTTIRYPFDIEGPEKILGASEEHYQGGREEEEERTVSAPAPQQAQGLNPMEVMMMMQKAEERAEARIMRFVEMMRPAQQPPDMTKQVFDIVEKLAPMMGGGDGGSPWMMALSQFKEPIIKLVDSISQVATRQAQPMPMTGARASAQVQPSPQPQTEEDMIKLMVRQYMPVFINAATKNADPEFYADMVLDQVPESMYPKLKEWIEKPTCLEEIASIEPGVRYQQEWWNSLRAAILHAMLENANSLQSPSASSELEQDS